MNKDVLITISGMQTEYIDTEGSEYEAIEVVNSATYFFKDGLHYIFFEEYHEDTAAITKNKIVFKQNEYLEVVKKGGTNSDMKFQCGEVHESTYETPYGEMFLEITTREVVTEIAESEIVVKTRYELALNCESYAECEITMRIVEDSQVI